MTTDEVMDKTAFHLWRAYSFRPGEVTEDDARTLYVRERDHYEWLSTAREAWRIAAYNRTTALAAQARGETPPELALPPDGWGGNPK